MTAQELKEIALNASREQFEKLIAELKKIAEAGGFSCVVSDLTDGTLELLRQGGFKVTQRREGRLEKLTNSWDVSVNKTD